MIDQNHINEHENFLPKNQMTFKSILFNQRDWDSIDQTNEAPLCFPDLNLDQLVSVLIEGRRRYNLEPFLFLPLDDVDLINFRHEIFRDLENRQLHKNIEAFSEKMIEMHRYLNLSHELRNRYHKEGWFLEAAIVYCEAIKGLNQALQNSNIKSRGLIGLKKYLSRYITSNIFTLLAEETRRLENELSKIRYTIIIKGSKVSVKKFEGEKDYTKEVLNTFEKFKQGEVKDYSVNLRLSAGMNHVKARILENAARLNKKIFSELIQFSTDKTDFLDPVLKNFEREIQFYLAYLDLLKRLKQNGLSFSYPVVSPSNKGVVVQQTFDIVLAEKMTGLDEKIVCNDLYLEENERLMVISGPNQGGKTTFARTFGQIHYLARLGLPVPGSKAQLFLCDQIFTHFEKEEDIRNLRGKLKDDLVRIHAILEEATEHSIIIMNEIFTSTALEDALFLSKQILERILALDCISVCVTFLDELSRLTPNTVSMVSTVNPNNPADRTYQFFRKPADGLAYAICIAEKYALTFKKIKERIQP